MRNRYSLMAETLSLNRMRQETFGNHCPVNGK